MVLLGGLFYALVTTDLKGGLKVYVPLENITPKAVLCKGKPARVGGIRRRGTLPECPGYIFT